MNVAMFLAHSPALPSLLFPDDNGMLLRLSTKLAAKLKVTPAVTLPLDANSLADWSAHCFTAGRLQFVIVTNTRSLYSVVLESRGIMSPDRLLSRFLDVLREHMERDGLSSKYNRLVAPASGSAVCSKAMNRSVTSSMNDMISHAKMWLTEGLSTNDTALELNDMPFSSLDYRKPREVFESLAAESGA